ncbi:ATP phosphoribosyltransferase [Mycobacterium kansasii 824]|nr:ATP phosphoribosyltransferase [Mycobacterium kansasii 824]
MLRVAVPNKGALSEPATEILAEAGYRRRTDPKDLTVIDPANNVEFFFLRPKDIAIYVGSGQLDFGITGRDLVCDSDAPVRERLALGFGSSSFRYAGPAGGIGRRPTWPESGSPPPIRTSSEKTWPPRASRQP